MFTVLVIEDDSVMLKAIEYILKKDGFHTVSARNGKEAFALIDAGGYDLVITDLMMPFSSGLEVISRVRSHLIASNAGIIVISAMGQESTITEAFALGADDYLIKPILVGELLSRIRKLFSSKSNAGTNRSPLSGEAFSKHVIPVDRGTVI